MSGGQQGLFSSVLGFLSREVQDFVSTATGSSTSEVSARSFAIATTIEISVVCSLFAVRRELLHRRARITAQTQSPNERHGTPGEKDCMRAIRKATMKRTNGESNATRFADPLAVFDLPAARHTLQHPPHHAERTRTCAVLPPHDVKNHYYPRKMRRPVAPIERRRHLVHAHLPPMTTTTTPHMTGTQTTTQVHQSPPQRRKKRRNLRHKPFPARCVAGCPSRCPEPSSLAAHRWTHNQPPRPRSAMYTSRLGPHTSITRCSCRARRAPRNTRALLAPAPSPSPVDPARHRSARWLGGARRRIQSAAYFRPGLGGKESSAPWTFLRARPPCHPQGRF